MRQSDGIKALERRTRLAQGHDFGNDVSIRGVIVSRFHRQFSFTLPRRPLQTIAVAAHVLNSLPEVFFDVVKREQQSGAQWKVAPTEVSVKLRLPVRGSTCKTDASPRVTMRSEAVRPVYFHADAGLPGSLTRGVQ